MSYYRDAPGYGTQQVGIPFGILRLTRTYRRRAQFTFAPPPQPEFRPEPGCECS